MNAEKQIMKKLEKIEKDVEGIKKHMADVDTALTEDDIESLQEAEKDLREGKTTSLSKLKEELGL